MEPIMSDTIQDIKDYFTDRFSSPFWASFLIAWLTINWPLPITAIFESAKFNVSIISNYLLNTPASKTFVTPLIIAFAYSILGSSFKEILEILSKTIRSLFSQIDRKGIFYKSISLIEHDKQLARLHRQIKKNEKDKEELTELSAENTRLENEIQNLKIELKNKIDYESQNHTLARENSTLSQELDELKAKLTNLRKSSEAEKTSFHKKYDQKDSNTRKEESSSSESQKTTNLSKPSTYIDKLKSLCDRNILGLFDNPNSRANLLVVLDLLDNDKFFNIDEVIRMSGVKKDIFLKTYKLASSANLITANNAGLTTLTSQGKQKIKELQIDPELLSITKAFEALNISSKKEILSRLRKSSLEVHEIKELIQFNQKTKQLLSELTNENQIHIEGSVFFFGPKPKSHLDSLTPISLPPLDL